MKARTYDTAGMLCPACAKILDRKLERLPGVMSAESDLLRGVTSIVFDQMRIDEDGIEAAIRQAGFEVSLQPRRSA